MKVGVKPYPSCRYTHAALDGLKALRREHGFTGDQVRKVEIGLHRNGIKLTGEPEAAKRRPANVVDGQFSMAFTGAVALDQGGFGWDDYRRLGDPRIEALADVIEVRQDDRVEAGSPHPFGAWVRVTTDRGLFERAVKDPPGEPESFPDDDAMMAKFLTLAEPVLGPAADRFAQVVLGLDRAADLSGLLLARPPGGGIAQRAGQGA
jgi:2-methylcitrate dehydratase PrpD